MKNPPALLCSAFRPVALAAALAGLIAAATAQTNVPYERIRRADAEPGNWLTNGGNYSAHRYSTLDQITPENVAKLRPAWIYQQADTSKWETTPIVVDGIMYITERPNIVTAIDARTGRAIWNYRRPFPDDVRICCGTPNRGMAILGDSVYFNTFDAHLVCLDANTGLERWDVVVEDYKIGYSMTGAPLAVKDKVLVGVAGAEFGIRGLIDAYDAKTGKRVWRFWTIPGPGEPGNETWGPGDAWKTGGGSTWGLGTFDPELNTVYWGTGNAAPDYNGDNRPGDNLWANSIVALDADTGKMKWGFQATPHDLHDWDANQVPVLIDTVVNGKPRKVVVQANRNGFCYVIDRVTGQFITGQMMIKQTWTKGLDETGRPILIPGLAPSEEGVLVYPGLGGAVNWPGPAYSPQTNMIYVQAQENYGQYFYKYVTPYKPGEHFENGGGRNVLGAEPYGVLKAIDVTTAKVQWEFKIQSYAHAPALATATGLVFSGTHEGQVFALDARTGKELWKFMVGTTVYGGPVSFLVGGKQHIAVTAGAGLFVFAL
jgi:alcohol dehydrogenase (cytochrome c)